LPELQGAEGSAPGLPGVRLLRRQAGRQGAHDRSVRVVRVRVAVDAMGSDGAPAIEIAGAELAARAGIDVVLVGRGLRTSLPVIHASEVVTMDDHPAHAFRKKKDSSLRVAIDLVRAGKADAVVSAGNTGAVLATAVLVLGRAPGVDRPAIVTVFPTP